MQIKLGRYALNMDKMLIYKDKMNQNEIATQKKFYQTISELQMTDYNYLVLKNCNNLQVL